MKLSLFIRWILGLLFIYASIDKIRYPQEFLKILYNYRIFPDIILNPIVIILPWLELITGVCLLTGLFMEGAVLLINLLLISFFLIILVDMLKGINIECGCFNLTENPSAKNSMLWYLIRDAFLISMATYLMKDIWKKKRR
ncbi:MAG: hypothetical protein DRG39_08120 [Deltaproteobacteria bacterium]|nr:MAG: hypothetical protein DRG39_08120 [Deltaproteobacteria bacterium]